MFIDYYSILNISFPSNDEEINTAYTAKKESLGEGSKNNNNPNYLMRVNIELAYRILGVSYALKTAYDEEYQNAIAKGFDTYEIQDDWLQSSIERERNFVINRILATNHIITTSYPTKRKSWGIRILGCFSKILLFYMLIISFAIPKACRNKIKDSIANMELSENVEQKLNYIAMTENLKLPQDMNENITMQAMLIESDALVYVYKIDDAYFLEIKNSVISKYIQLNQIRSVYDDMKPMIKALIATHRGLCYRYICRESGEVAECKIDYSDLVNLQQ